MGRGKYIYLTDELYEALKTIDNASALIQDLLRQHFNLSGSSDDLKQQLDSLKTKEVEFKKEIEMKRGEIEEKMDKARIGKTFFSVGIWRYYNALCLNLTTWAKLASSSRLHLCLETGIISFVDNY